MYFTGCRSCLISICFFLFSANRWHYFSILLVKNIARMKLHNPGFTVVELAILIAVWGMLAAIATVGFQRYQAKSRQGESKLALSGMYAAQKTFYSTYSAYIPDVDAMGFTPEGTKRFYSAGWANAWTGSVSGYTNPATTTPSINRTSYPSTWTNCNPALSTVPAATSTDPQSFTIIASGQIRGGQNCDVWSIDELKTLRNITVGL